MDGAVLNDNPISKHAASRTHKTATSISLERKRNEIKLNETVYNNTIKNRLLSLGPPWYAKLGLISLG
jgi:hypothetical protein